MRALFVAPLAFATSLAAQGMGTVYGSVHDSAGRPIGFGMVVVVGTSVVARISQRGDYRAPSVPVGSQELRTKVLGYESQTATVHLAPGDSVRIDFVLALSAVQMGPMVVTAAKRAQSLADVVPSVALMSDSDIAKRAVNTIDEAVDKAPGVQFLNGQVNIRGSTGYVQGLGSRVLLLVDGVPANQGDRGGISWDLLPVDDVERVEVVPPHSEWRFRDYTGTRGGADLTSSYGRDDLRGAVIVGGWRSDGYRQQDHQDHWQLAGKGEWQASPDTRLSISGSWASDQYQVPLAWCEHPTGCDDRGQAYQPFLIDTSGLGSHTRSDKGYLAAVLARAPSERVHWQVRTSWLRTHFTDFQPKSHDDYGVADRFGGELRGEFRPDGGSSVVTVGAETGLSDITSNIFGSHRQGEYASYGEGERPLGGRESSAHLTAGARIDFLTIDGGALSAVVSPRVGVVLSAGGGTWRASAGRGFRAPSLAERFVSTVVSGFMVVPNPNLEPETAWTFEVGHARPIGSTARVDAALFWTEARQLIEPSIDTIVVGVDTQVVIQFKNLARARLAGLDLAVRANPLTPQLSTTLGYTFLYARELAQDSVPQRPLAFRPRHLLTLAADFTAGAIGVGAEFRYSSRFERVELTPPTDPRVAAKVLDLRAGWARGPVSVRLLVANALNYLYNYAPRTLEPVRTVSVTLVYLY